MPRGFLEQQGGPCSWSGGCEGREEDVGLGGGDYGATQAMAGIPAFPLKGVVSHCSVLSREVGCSD